MNLDDIFKNGFKSFLILTVTVSAICIIVWLSIDKKIEKYNKEHPDRTVSKTFISSAIRVVYSVMGFLLVISQIKPLDPFMNTLFSAGGVLAVCFTFASRESLSNYISGLLLAIHQPFKIGEEINLEALKVKGIVKDITFRHTIVETESGSVVTIPNALMGSIAVEDLTNVKKPEPRKKRTSSK